MEASDPRWERYEHKLTDGWVPGRKIVSKHAFMCYSRLYTKRVP